MIKTIFIMFLSSLILIGLMDILKSIKSIIFKPKQSNFSIVLPIKDANPNIEFTIRSLSHILNMEGCKSNLIIADLGMDFETLQTCYAMTNQDSKIIICNPKEIEYFTCSN